MNKKQITTDQRPAVWVGHIAMHTARVTESCEFMQRIGMRLVTSDDDFALLELRGGTHLVLTNNPDSELIKANFDLMVEDIDASHAQFVELGLEPGEIERGNIHDSFEMREPGGSTILFNSSHVGDLPV